MNSLTSRAVFILLFSLLVAACSGGGGLAGIGGSGFISSGTITGFGSVFVNGIEFETGSATFEVEDADGSQQDLRIGMVVQVQGTINSDGVTGTATHIQYGDDLQGPVSIITASADIISLTIFGKSVAISATETSLEGIAFADIADGNVIEVSGYYDQNGVMQASYVELKSISFDASSVFEIKGVIRNLNGTDFDVEGVSVDASVASFSDLPNGLQNGQLVEVKGRFTNNQFSATEVEGENEDLEDSAEVEIEGLITRYVSTSDFDVNGQKVNAGSAEFSPASLVLKLGLKVEVKGSVSQSVLMANEVEAREGSAHVSAEIASIDQANRTFSVDVLSGQLVVVKLTTATRMEDEVGDNNNPLISKLNTGDFIDVQGFESASNTITATQIRREFEVKDTELQGVVTSASTSGFTILGVTYPVNVETVYDNADDVTQFLGLITVNESIINIVDNVVADGFADEMEIED